MPAPRASVSKLYAETLSSYPRRIKGEYATLRRVSVRACAVSFVDVRGIRHTVEVQAESLYEAAVLAVKAFRSDPWIERVGPATVLDVDVREPSTRHSLSLQQVERWLDGVTSSPLEASKKAKLKMLMIRG